ncbi:MAG: starch-binding outer membrane protein SusD/RagB family [Bacteroidales bacterium]|nr:starch-binding outer membrane protein SusD/RagB family [Bacteroidales bacterium]
MKIYKFFIIILFVGFSFHSCDEFLDEQNPNSITDNSFWKSEDDFTKGLMATYQDLQANYVMGGGTATDGHVLSDIVTPNPWGSSQLELHNHYVSDVNSYVTDKWYQLYTGIFRANQVLENLQEADFPESFKTNIEAEARFLRGVFYFWLATNYNNGSIILHKSIPINTEEFYKPLSSREEVYELIIEDLLFAQKNLPEKRPTSELGRATWGAATAKLGKVYLYEERFDEARNEFKKIIDSDLYSLTPEISWNFDLEHEHNSESIFEINFTIATNPPQSTSRAASIAPQEAGGGRSIEPAYNFIELCKKDPLDPSDPRNKGQVYSIRALATICFKGDGQIFYQRPTLDFPFIVEQEAHIKKFQNWTWPEERSDGRSGINERVIRLADVYLMYAETVLKTSGNVEEAIKYINMVRERSGVLKLNKEEYDVDKLLTHIMRVERPLELFVEGHMIRWNDLRRWGIVKEVLGELSQIKYRAFPDWLREATPEDLEDPDAEIRVQFTKAYQNYDPQEDNFFPIPHQELLTNEQLSIN